MSWLATDEIVGLYEQRDHERAYWIDRNGATHYMGDMDTSYLWNLTRFLERHASSHLAAAANQMFADDLTNLRQFAPAGRQLVTIAESDGEPIEVWQDMPVNDDALLAFDQEDRQRADEWGRVVEMSKTPWDTPLVQNLTRHICARTL